MKIGPSPNDYIFLNNLLRLACFPFPPLFYTRRKKIQRISKCIKLYFWIISIIYRIEGRKLNALGCVSNRTSEIASIFYRIEGRKFTTPESASNCNSEITSKFYLNASPAYLSYWRTKTSKHLKVHPTSVLLKSPTYFILYKKKKFQHIWTCIQL